MDHPNSRVPADGPSIDEIRRGICRLIPEWDPAELVDFEYLPGGYSNHNFRFARQGAIFVVRAPIERPGSQAVQHERSIYEASMNLSIPGVVAMNDDGWLVTRWVDGPLLVDDPPTAESLVGFVARVHGSLAADAAPYDPVARSRRYLAMPGDAAPDARVLDIASRLAWRPEDRTACHNDLNPWNVIVSRTGDWVTLDWQSVGLNDPLFDLVTLHQGLSLPDATLPALCEELLERPVASERVERVLTAFWLREHAWAFASAQLGNRRQEILDQLALSLDRLASLAS